MELIAIPHDPLRSIRSTLKAGLQFSLVVEMARAILVLLGLNSAHGCFRISV